MLGEQKYGNGNFCVQECAHKIESQFSPDWAHLQPGHRDGEALSQCPMGARGCSPGSQALASSGRLQTPL